MNKEWIILAGGVHALCFAVFHALFWKLFHWKTDLNRTSKPNKAILQIANIQLIYVFIFVTIICFWFPHELYTTSLGNTFLAGASAFWLVRFVQQFIFLKINHWLVHVLSVLFLAGAVLFALPLL